MNTNYHEYHEELNEISEEDFALYENEAEDIDLVLEELEDLALLKPQAYTPTIRDLERTSAVRHGYYGYEQLPCGSLPQSKILGPQLLVRKNPASTPYNIKGLSEEPFLEFWLEPIGGVEPSPALQEIRNFLDENENNELPIPEELLVLAKLENPDAPARRYVEWMPREITMDDDGLDTLRECFRLIDGIPSIMEELTEVLEQAVTQVENNFARMSPYQPTGDHIASSKTVAADPTKLTGIASLSSKTTSAAKPKTAAG